MLDAPFPLQLGFDFLPPLPPSVPFFAGALLVVLARRHQALKALVLLLVPACGVLNLLSLENGSFLVWQVQGLELVQLRVDRLSMLFGWLFHLGTLIGAVYALKVRDTSEHVAALAYAGSAL